MQLFLVGSVYFAVSSKTSAGNILSFEPIQNCIHFSNFSTLQMYCWVRLLQ